MVVNGLCYDVQRVRIKLSKCHVSNSVIVMIKVYRGDERKASTVHQNKFLSQNAICPSPKNAAKTLMH